MVSIREYNDGWIIAWTSVISISKIFKGPEIIPNHKLVFLKRFSRHFIKMEWKNRWRWINNSIKNDKNIFINGEARQMYRLMFIGTSYLPKLIESQCKYRTINIEYNNSMLWTEKTIIHVISNDLNSGYSIR